jgi:Phosphodiester glycosidase
MRTIALASLLACSSPSPSPSPSPSSSSEAHAGEPGGRRPAQAEAPAARPPLTKPACPGAIDLAPGLRAEKVRLPGRDECLTLVRIDPARFELRVHTAAADGGARPAPRWAEEFGLVAVINTSMFGDGDRSIGILRSARSVDRDRDNPRLGGFFAFDPVAPSAAPVMMTGRNCPGFDLADVRRRYRGLIQNYRLLGCRGGAMRWSDPKIYSAAAVGLDRAGHVVFLHARAPMRMAEFSRFLASPELGLRGAMYVEGGPEASLFAAAGGARVEEMGSFETGFWDHSNRRFWPIPNVLGAAPRPARAD